MSQWLRRNDSANGGRWGVEDPCAGSDHGAIFGARLWRSEVNSDFRSDLNENRAVCLHELAHIAQQRGGSRGTDKFIDSREAAESKAEAAVQAALKGERFELSAVKGLDRLYKDSLAEDAPPEQETAS